MNMTPKLLGVFTQIYGSNDAMDFGKAALVAVVGFFTVIVILAIIALFIKAIAAIFDKTSKTAKRRRKHKLKQNNTCENVESA
mgnify:CR=1 FL=1